MDHGAAKEHRNGLSAVAAGDCVAPMEIVRSRWTPKPEQILILESIFNSGMVNPSKDEAVRIRKLLEQFGAVGDANVFYWFQNRRSRSRRRQRQLQAALMIDRVGSTSGDAVALCEQYSSSNSSCSSSASFNHKSGSDGGRGAAAGGFLPCSSSYSACFIGSGADDGDLFAIFRQMGIMESSQSPFLRSSELSQLPYQAGTITVFINGMAYEVPKGPVDLSAAFGPNVILMHSSGQLLPVNEYGILQQSLQNGESYFLVSALNGG